MNYTEYLKKNNIKVTKGRTIIMDIFCNAEISINADYIFEKCKENEVAIDLSTIYRTLELLENKEIIEKFDLGDGKYNYKLKKDDHKHTLECSLCHKEVEIPCPMVQIEEIIKNKTGFTFMEHELKIKGVCEKCKTINKK